MSLEEIQQAWDHFLQEVELARNYHMPYRLNGLGGTFRNPLLDHLLPSLLHIKLVAILDEALIGYIAECGLVVPTKYRNSLHSRIEFLNDQSLIANYTTLHDIRDLRNQLAHGISQTTKWEHLGADINGVEQELQHLGIAGPRPNYEYFGKQSKMRDCDEPGIAFAQDFRFGIKSGDHVTMEFSFTRKTHNSSE